MRLPPSYSTIESKSAAEFQTNLRHSFAWLLQEVQRDTESKVPRHQYHPHLDRSQRSETVRLLERGVCDSVGIRIAKNCQSHPRWLQRQETERLILDGLTRLFSKLRFRRLMEMVWATSPDKATYVNTSPRETRGRTREKWGGRKGRREGRKRRKKEKEEVIIFTHSRRLGYNPWRRGRQTATHELNAYRGLRD